MRCYLHAFLLFALSAALSVLYGFSQIASTSLVDRRDRSPNQDATLQKSSHDAASALRGGPGLAGLCEREGPDR